MYLNIIKPYIKAILAMTAIMSIAGCGNGGLVNSTLTVLGGQNDSSSAPSTVLLQTSGPGGYSDHCTGTFISHDMILTAAHCLPAEVSQVAISRSADSSAAPIYSNEFYVHPEYRPSPSSNTTEMQDIYSDVAIIRVPSGTASPDMIAQFAPQTPLIGSVVHIVGYGGNDFHNRSGNMVRRSGSNRVYHVLDDNLNNLIVLHGPNQQFDNSRALISWGDSGGALYDELYRIVGIAISSGKISETENQAFFSNINNPRTRNFIQRFISPNAGANPSHLSNSGTDSFVGGDNFLDFDNSLEYDFDNSRNREFELPRERDELRPQSQEQKKLP